MTILLQLNVAYVENLFAFVLSVIETTHFDILKMTNGGQLVGVKLDSNGSVVHTYFDRGCLYVKRKSINQFVYHEIIKSRC